MSDDRADLSEEFSRVIAELRPELSAMGRLRTQNGLAECASPETLHASFSAAGLKVESVTTQASCAL
jgi:hypothetical protein